MTKNSLTLFAIMAMMLCAATALNTTSALAQSQVGVGVGAEVKIGAEDENDSQDDRHDDSENKIESETRITVSVNNGKASVHIEFDGKTDTYVLQTDDEASIIASIESQTGLSEEEIRSIWDFQVKSTASSHVKSEEQSEMESKTSVSVRASTENSNDARTKAMQVIAELKQRLTELENRFQTIMIKLESGAYFGNTLGGDDVTNSYHIVFDGNAVAVSDSSTNVDYSGELFLESIITRDDQSKFKVTGGHIQIDGETYEVLFGKTRTSVGLSGEKNTMVILTQVVGNDQKPTTLKLLVAAENNFESDFGEDPEHFNVLMPSSKIASQWFLDGSGEISLV